MEISRDGRRMSFRLQASRLQAFCLLTNSSTYKQGTIVANNVQIGTASRHTPTHPHTHTHPHTPTHPHNCTPTHTNTQTHKHTNTHTHTHTHTYTHTHTHTHTHTQPTNPHTHTYTHTPHTRTNNRYSGGRWDVCRQNDATP